MESLLYPINWQVELEQRKREKEEKRKEQDALRRASQGGGSKKKGGGKKTNTANDKDKGDYWWGFWNFMEITWTEIFLESIGRQKTPIQKPPQKKFQNSFLSHPAMANGQQNPLDPSNVNALASAYASGFGNNFVWCWRILTIKSFVTYLKQKLPTTLDKKK